MEVDIPLEKGNQSIKEQVEMNLCGDCLFIGNLHTLWVLAAHGICLLMVCGLNKNVPHRFIYLNTLSSVGATVFGRIRKCVFVG